MTAKLILLRHGQSEWNKRNLFTGWVDVPLSVEGIQEAIDAGRKISHIPIDVIYISSLMRAQMTAMIAMAHHEEGKVPVILHSGEGKTDDWGKIHNPAAAQNSIPVIKAWELNERMYGDLQGLNKQETREKYGDEQVHIWRRSFDVPPPNGECLADTAARVIPYFREKIVPHLASGQNVFISAHGNSLRSIIMHLDNLSKEEVLNLELATGDPILYEYANNTFKKNG
ncbi:MAG: 2,3-bisphosphoglycerate-dependent phosphoglycerate mutase [Simkaniaceae bacterium]|nr:2,3-bisphosphoglycerate-dependent phosphoglycerate mutase [Candidatus Sacchlamyda saccharinae]